MIEMKQLQYMVVCADLQSFSRAADALYTTQPNVSKIIKTLEEELGFELFVRQNRGIQLSSRGKKVYNYAYRVMENMQQLTEFAQMDRGEELLISCNPSSWMAAGFAEFYNLYKDQDICFHMITASTENIVKRCAEGQDDMGFIYLMESQLPSFQYKLERGHLSFHELKRTKAKIYFGPQNPLSEKSSVEEIPMESVRLVQCYEDEFTVGHNWDLFMHENGKKLNMKVSVITNSDYVMNELLENTDLGNISAAYLSHEEKELDHRGISLYGEEEPVIFGCIMRKDEEPGHWMKMYLAFIENRLKNMENR
jgi:DNA-binding transcriptional LysR family regulator